MIGLKPLVKPGEERNANIIEREILKHFGIEKANAFKETFDENSTEDHFDFCHKNLDRVKIWYGMDFYSIAHIAEQLKQLSIPNTTNVLDLGGGTGQIAFYMEKLWPNSNITVIDKFSEVGREWAKKINADRVNFVDGLLPNLESLKGQRYDLIVMCRVLGFMEKLNLPSGADNFDTESYFSNKEGTRLFGELEKIAESINDHLKYTGHLVVIDSWSDFRTLIVGRSFERKGLYIDLEYFSAKEVQMNYSAIVFSKNKTTNNIQDLPLGLSTIISFRDEEHGNIFYGITAESLRKLFVDARVIKEVEYVNKDDERSYHEEILEKEGFALLYCTHTGGNRMAIMNSALSIPFLMDFRQKHQDKISSKYNVKIIKEK